MSDGVAKVAKEGVNTVGFGVRGRKRIGFAYSLLAKIFSFFSGIKIHGIDAVLDVMNDEAFESKNNGAEVISCEVEALCRSEVALGKGIFFAPFEHPCETVEKE